MAKRTMRQVIPLLALSVAFAGGTLCGDAISHETGHKGHHASHGGVLNVIGREAGHVEIRLTDGLLELWFVGGGNDTHRAVPIGADKVELIVKKKLVLDAAPLLLAGETEGDCSHFVARADWLSGMKEFTAHGDITFKGHEYELLIRYPDGYDPFHSEAEHHGSEHQ